MKLALVVTVLVGSWIVGTVLLASFLARGGA